MRPLLLASFVLRQLRQSSGEELATVAISTFLLELTMQRRPDRKLRGTNATPTATATATPRQLTSSGPDELIQSLAEQHLAEVYGELFVDPSQVLLTVVTTGDSADSHSVSNDTDDFFVRSSFVGGVVSFPLGQQRQQDILDGSGSSNHYDDNNDHRDNKIPSRSQIWDATMEAFAIPGYGEDFLNDLLQAQNEQLEGLLYVSAKEVEEGDSIAGQNGATANTGLDKIQTQPDPNTNNAGADNYTDADDNNNQLSLANNIWAIAAVAALGAMFLTILSCTTILWCDWRKRKARKELIKQQKIIKQQQMAQSRTGNNEEYFAENIRAIPTLASEETAETPSHDSQERFTTNNHNHNNNHNRPSLINHIRNKSIVSKSKAAQNHLQLSRSIDDEDPVSSPSKSFQEPAPSVTYSVGEDTTTMLYPAIHRGRQNSRDLSEFDGYSMDGYSHMDGTTAMEHSSNASANNKHNHPLLAQRSVIYSGEVPRDFDSVWDDESKITSEGHERKLSVDDDSILGKSIVGNNQVAEKDTVGNLTSSLNPLDEDQSSKTFFNEFDSESEDEAGSNRGAFTLELLKGSTGKKGRKSIAADDDDSILGDFGGRSELMDASIAMEEVEEEEEQDGEAKVPSSEKIVNSSPSWSGRIKSALMLSSTSKTQLNTLDQLNTSSDGDEEHGVASYANAIFRPAAAAAASSTSSKKVSPVTSPIDTAASQESKERSDLSTNNNRALGNQSSPSSVKDKFVSSLGLSLSFSKTNDDDGSVSSSRSAKSSTTHRSNTSGVSHGSRVSTGSGAAGRSSKSKQSRALGLTNSMDEEVDEDPADMIENINNMLSECRVILDTDMDAQVIR